MKESDFQSDIIDAATKLGYEHYHTHRSDRSDPGFPDLVLVSVAKARVVFIEVKGDNGQVTPEQAHWHEILAICDEEVYVVRPENFDELVEILMLPSKPSKTVRLGTETAVVSV